MKKFAVFLAFCAMTTALPSAAKDIPVEIHWVGTQPDRISRSFAGGFQQLSYDESTKAFRGIVQISGSDPEPRNFTVSYGDFNQSINVRVYPYLDKIEFTVELRPAQSCTGRMVVETTKVTTSVQDALREMMSAGQLLSIRSPNDCDRDQARLAMRARYLQNNRLGALSQGFFMVDPEFTQAYRMSVADTVAAADVDSEIGRYADLEASLEAVQLGIARTRAQEDRNFGLAAAISGTMYQRMTSNEEIRLAYVGARVNAARLANETTYLTSLANAQGQSVEGP